MTNGIGHFCLLYGDLASMALIKAVLSLVSHKMLQWLLLGTCATSTRACVSVAAAWKTQLRSGFWTQGY